ncbi:DUF4296 domain-containing protein [Deminuibacter soli]|uniref:DUF4296 domain-containing protein n=1 Tax=Deminuibacter soli TaxID=2291815 RepID=A0A3E1NDN0_9BACT|nr:DUF4296 domain-containing protein [Deminuibacter soli]RFM26050.1 DUF4296 domain-containing protein [Deminuibacter soli]
MKKLMVCAGMCCLLACKSNNKPGKDIITPDSMKVIVWDLLRAEQLASLRMQKDTNKIKKDTHLELYQDVFTIHHTTKEAFYKSYNFYLMHPNINKVLNDSLSNMAERTRMQQFQPKKLDTKADVK